jgi:CRP-like cAMP-binding protein
MNNNSVSLNNHTLNIFTNSSTGFQNKKFDSFKFLSSHPYFSKIQSEKLNQLVEYSKVTSIKAGEYIISEGDRQSIYGYIVIDGTIAVTKSSSNGKELIVELLQAGDIFGLFVALAQDKVPSQLSTKGLEKSLLMWIPLDQFTSLFSSNCSLLNTAVSHLLTSLQASYCLARGLAHDKVHVRIATILISLAIKHTRHSDGEACYVINLTRQQLADLTGTTQETAIRVTRAMEKSGIIDIRLPGIIRVKNLKLLSNIAEE